MLFNSFLGLIVQKLEMTDIKSSSRAKIVRRGGGSWEEEGGGRGIVLVQFMTHNPTIHDPMMHDLC